MKPILRWQYEQITKCLLLIQGHSSSIECPCSSEGEACLRKHYLELEALCEETSPICDDEEMKQKLFDLTKEARELRADEELKLCGKDGQLDTDIAAWSRNWRKQFEQACLVCDLAPAEEILEEVARMFRKKREPRWCNPVKETDEELGKLSRTLGTAKKRIAEIQRHLEMPLNICRGQAEMFESTTGVLDPYGSRCRDPGTGQWVYSEECGFEPAGITTTALGMDGITRYEFEFKIVSIEKLIVSHNPFTFEANPEYPKELQPRLRERAATKIQVEKIAANLEPDAVITDFHVIDRGTPIVGPDLVVEAGNGRVMGIAKAVAEYPDKYADYKNRLRERAHDYGLSAKDIDSVKFPVLVRVRITDVDRTTFTQEANQAATIAPSAIENARIDATKITLGMLQELIIGENESLEDALRAPKNQAFAKRFLSTLPETVQAALVDAQGYLNRDGVHRMAMGVFVSAFQGDSGLRLAEKAFESIDMDVRNTVNAIARSLGPLAQAEALTRSGDRDTSLSIGDDLAQTVNVYSAIKRNPALTVEKYLAQEQIFARELTPFQEGILVVLDEYRKSPKKLGGIFTAYAEGVISAPPPAQVALFPGAEITKEGLWESAIKAPEAQPVLMEVTRMFEVPRYLLSKFYLVSIDEEIVLPFSFITATRAFNFAREHSMVKRGYTGIRGKTVIRLIEKGVVKAGKLPEGAVKMFEETCEHPSAKYQYLSGFFTESLPEAVLFATEAGVIERKIDTVLAKLESGIAEIYESSKFKDFIDTMAKFHNYSLGNIMLITLQKPGATRVAGYRTWQVLERNVKEGEHGIMILAPCFPPKPKKEEGEDEEEIEPELSPIYFKVVHVFDVAQTEGKELPLIEVPVITGEKTGPLFREALSFVIKQGIVVSSVPDPKASPDLMGYWSKPQKLIWVRPDVPQNQKTKTLLHEIAHAMCEMRGARDAEVMAESVAYTVANHFGYDTGVRSFPYVALWAKDVKVLKSNLEIIRKVAKDMIEGIEHVAELSGAGDKHDIIKSVLDMEIWLGQLDLGKTQDRVKTLAKLKLGELELLWRDLIGVKYDREKIVEQSVYIGLGRKVPAYLQENTLSAIGSAAITGIGIAAGFKFFDWLVKKFSEKGGELGAPMMLLTKEIRNKLPPLYSQEKVEDPMVQVKFFTPDSNWTWYGIEFDGEDRFFGWVVDFEKELGYFSLSELESARGPMGLAIERDKWFKPMPLSEVKKLHAHERGELGEMGQSKIWAHNPRPNEWYIYEEIGTGKDATVITLASVHTEQEAEWMILGIKASRAQKGAKLKEAEMGDRRHYFCDWIDQHPHREIVQILTDEEDPKCPFCKRVMTYGAFWGSAQAREKGYAGLGDARQVPKEVDVFKTTIEKHYRPTEDFHEGSIRVVKPETDVLVYLGCLRSDDWNPESPTCLPNPTVLKTIVPNNKKYLDELNHLKLVHPEVKINYQTKEVGTEPVVSEEEQEELRAVDNALEHAEEVS